MSGIPEVLAVPLKKPVDLDVVKPLKNLISSAYSTADRPQDFTEAIVEFGKQRNNAVWRALDKNESSLEVLYSYYDQLCALEGKIPAHELQIPFKWKDAFDKGSIFGGRISLTVSSLRYEKMCILFNIAALQSAVASNMSLEFEEGLKMVAKLMQQSAGIFNYLKDEVMSAIQQDPTPDLNPETLGTLSALMLAQAQEAFVLKAMKDLRDGSVAKLASCCEDLYASVLKPMQQESLKVLWDKDWVPLVAGKQAAYHAISQYYQSRVNKANSAVGEELARLTHAAELMKSAAARSNRPNFFSAMVKKINHALVDSKKDNDFIYHERVPELKDLEPIAKIYLAKKTPLPETMSANFRDLFQDLVPVSVHQAMAAYDVRKNEIVNTEIMRMRESTQFLNSVLASLNLPAALEDSAAGGTLPKSLLDKSAAVCAAGGVQQLEAMHRELPELLKRNKEILDEAERLLTGERDSDQQLKTQFKERWNRTPSEKLTETFRQNLAKYREIINNAVGADSTVQQKFAEHHRGMTLLSGGATAMMGAVPSVGPGGADMANSSAAQKLRQLMNDVEAIKAERDAIEGELKSATTDMQATFLSALAGSTGINEPAMSVETLGKVYGPLQKRVAASIARQENLVAEIQTSNSEMCRQKSSSSDSARNRDEVMKQIAAAHDAYMQLQNNLKEGAKFYNDLTELLVAYQNKISDYCFARKTEKEELLKDLTESASRPPMLTPVVQPAPNAYEYAGPSGIAYPTHANMPVPYGATPAAPYPTYMPPPMPQGYNPYGAPTQPLPYPVQQGAYGYPGYPPAPGYAGYPGGPPQQPPAGQPPQPGPHTRPW